MLRFCDFCPGTMLENAYGEVNCINCGREPREVQERNRERAEERVKIDAQRALNVQRVRRPQVGGFII